MTGVVVDGICIRLHKGHNLAAHYVAFDHTCCVHSLRYVLQLVDTWHPVGELNSCSMAENHEVYH